MQSLTLLIAVASVTINLLIDVSYSFLEIVSDCLGLPQEVPATTVGAAYGDAYLAGMGVGMFDDFATLRNEWVRPDRTIAPNPEATAVYEDMYPIYRATYENLKPQLHALADRQS